MAPKTPNVDQTKLEQALHDHLDWRAAGGRTRTFDFEGYNGGISYDNVPNLIGLGQNSDIVTKLINAGCPQCSNV